MASEFDMPKIRRNRAKHSSTLELLNITRELIGTGRDGFNRDWASANIEEILSRLGDTHPHYFPLSKVKIYIDEKVCSISLGFCIKALAAAVADAERSEI